MMTTPFGLATEPLRVVCNDNRLAQLCDEAIITKLMAYRPHGDYRYPETIEILTIASVLKRVTGNLTVLDLGRFLDDYEALSLGFLALMQDGAASFERGIGNFTDFNSGFSNGVYFVSRERYEEVWEYLTHAGIAIPPRVREVQQYDINLFGEPGLFIKPVHLGLDDVSICV